MKSVLRRPGTPTFCSRARSSRRSITYLARERPRVRTTLSKESTQSLVSSGSISGSCVGSPSLMIEKRWRPAATGCPRLPEVGRLFAAMSAELGGGWPPG